MAEVSNANVVQPGKKSNPVVTVLLVILLLVAAALAAWFYLDKQKLTSDNNDLRNQVEELQARNSEQTESAFEITEWGVQMDPGTGLSDLTYYIKKFNVGEAAYFTTRSLMSDADAAVDFTDVNADICYPGAIGAISRGKGDEPSSGDLTFAQDPNAVKAGDYYYIFTQPQANCSENASVINKQNDQISKLREAAKTLKPAE